MRAKLSLASLAAGLLVAAGAVAACGDDGEAAPPGAGAGGASGGGAVAGMAAPTAGTSAAGSMAGAPAGGSGPAAGSGGASGGGLTCASANTSASPAMLHAAAAMALLPQPTNKGCAFASCHDANSKKANLILTETPVDLRMQLVGKAACQVPSMQLVDTSGGDMALANSWLWQKLTAPTDSSGEIAAKPEWGTAATGCGQDTGTGFGLRMPRTGSDLLWSPISKLEAVRDWICAGAPGP